MLLRAPGPRSSSLVPDPVDRGQAQGNARGIGLLESGLSASPPHPLRGEVGGIKLPESGKLRCPLNRDQVPAASCQFPGKEKGRPKEWPNVAGKAPIKNLTSAVSVSGLQAPSPKSRPSPSPKACHGIKRSLVGESKGQGAGFEPALQTLRFEPLRLAFLWGKQWNHSLRPALCARLVVGQDCAP